MRSLWMAKISPTEPDKLILKFSTEKEVDPLENRRPHGAMQGPTEDKRLDSGQWATLRVGEAFFCDCEVGRQGGVVCSCKELGHCYPPRSVPAGKGTNERPDHCAIACRPWRRTCRDFRKRLSVRFGFPERQRPDEGLFVGKVPIESLRRPLRVPRPIRELIASSRF